MEVELHGARYFEKCKMANFKVLNNENKNPRCR